SKKRSGNWGTLVGRPIFEAAHCSVRIASKDQAAQIGDGQLIAVGFRLLVRNREQIERNATICVPKRLDRRQLRRLIFERIAAMRIAEEYLKRDKNGEQPEGHRQDGEGL